jgi:hypothetical protein
MSDDLIEMRGLEQRLVVAFHDADASRLAGLRRAQSIYAARAATLERERERLAEKYGAASAQSADAERRIAAHSAAVLSLDADAARASLPPFQVAGDVAVVHGLVVDAGFKGVAKALVVALGDDRRPVGEGETDASGYFKFEVPVGGPIGRLAVDTSARSGVRPGSVVRLSVAQGGKVVVEDQHALPLVAGQAVYRELTLTPPT